MRVNHVNETTKEFNGYRYFRQRDTRKGRYYRRRVGDTTISLHKAVWEYHNGVVPEGFHVHHKDHNWHNNQIENLELLSQKDHSTYHWSSETRRREQGKRVTKYATPRAKEWHGTPEGLKWHSEMSKKSWENRQPIEKECAYCHKKFQTLDRKQSGRFCHQNCKMNARRRRLRGLAEDAVL